MRPRVFKDKRKQVRRQTPRIDLSLTQAGFWTTTNAVVVAVAGGVVLVILLIFLGLAWRSGLLKKRAQ